MEYKGYIYRLINIGLFLSAPQYAGDVWCVGWKRINMCCTCQAIYLTSTKYEEECCLIPRPFPKCAANKTIANKKYILIQYILCSTYKYLVINVLSLKKDITFNYKRLRS